MLQASDSTLCTHISNIEFFERDKPEVTSRTDFVNKHSTLLQTTSYLFMGTENTSESCVSVVKPQKIVPKNPAQHAADLEMLSSIEEVKPALHEKNIECIRVDGSVDEGPSHQEVQFNWTERHLQQGTLCTVVTARFSGGSYLNKVELQNGCLALGHSNVFIPSTINGSNLDSNEKLDHEKLKQNLDTATDVYINTVSGSPCFGTNIILVKGAAGRAYHERRSNLLTFLQGSKKQVEILKRTHPEDFEEFSKIWNLRNWHMVTGLPSNYIFLLLPCYEADCPHPECAKGKPADEQTWYPGGPPLSLLPVPIQDPERPWGSKECTKCHGFCCGHYLEPEAHIRWVAEKGDNSCEKVPPRYQIEQYVKEKESIVQEDIEHIAKTCFLSLEDAEACIDHFVGIHQRRRVQQKRGKRKKKPGKADEDVYYICRQGEQGFMIQCSDCNEWFHGTCIEVTPEDAEQIKDYFCAMCVTVDDLV